MRIAIGADEKNSLTDFIHQNLIKRGFEVQLAGPMAGQQGTWPEVAHIVAEAVADGDADEGILLCWTGTGVSIAASKVPGIRAALCDDADTARGARLWNNANVLCLSIRRLSAPIAGEILDAWFTTQYKPNPEDDACLAAVSKIEEKYSR
jgi:ribose 5-phosphate isomerase B